MSGRVNALYYMQASYHVKKLEYWAGGSLQPRQLLHLRSSVGMPQRVLEVLLGATLAVILT